MLTSMLKTVELSNAAGQEYVQFTLDLRLYRVALQILWYDKRQFPNFYMRLGGMHLLMSFISASGGLMSGSSKNEILRAVFAGVDKMLSGKKFSHNVRALRMFVEEVMRPILLSDNYDITCMADLNAILCPVEPSKPNLQVVDRLSHPSSLHHAEVSTCELSMRETGTFTSNVLTR